MEIQMLQSQDILKYVYLVWGIPSLRTLKFLLLRLSESMKVVCFGVKLG